MKSKVAKFVAAVVVIACATFFGIEISEEGVGGVLCKVVNLCPEDHSSQLP